MLTEIVTPVQFLGIPQQNLPKYRIGDYVRHVFEVDSKPYPKAKKVEQVGRVTAILIYETSPGNPDTITANYTYIVTSSNSSRHAFMVGEEDSADEHELTLA